MGDSHVGLQARLMSQALRKLTGIISKSKTCVIFINQIRMKIGVMFGSPETTTGGNALKFYSSVRLDIRRIGAIKSSDQVMGNRTRVKVVKTSWLRRLGIMNSTFFMARDLASRRYLRPRHGYRNHRQGRFVVLLYGDRLGQGREQSMNFLREHVELTQSIEERIRLHLG